MSTSIIDQLRFLKSGEAKDALFLKNSLNPPDKYELLLGMGSFIVGEVNGLGNSEVYVPVPASLNSHAYIASTRSKWRIEEVDTKLISNWLSYPSQKWDAQLLFEKAIEFNQPELLKLAITQGADIHFSGFTELRSYPFDLVVDNYLKDGENEEIVATLLLEGARLDFAFFMATHHAITKSRFEGNSADYLRAKNLIDLMFSRGVDVNYADENGDTIIMTMMRKDFSTKYQIDKVLEIVSQLCEHGLDLDRRNQNDATVFDIFKAQPAARRSKLQPVVDLLDGFFKKKKLLERISEHSENISEVIPMQKRRTPVF